VQRILQLVIMQVPLRTDLVEQPVRALHFCISPVSMRNGVNSFREVRLFTRSLKPKRSVRVGKAKSGS
jgi:hypothetical protein